MQTVSQAVHLGWGGGGGEAYAPLIYSLKFVPDNLNERASNCISLKDYLITVDSVPYLILYRAHFILL